VLVSASAQLKAAAGVAERAVAAFPAVA